MNCPDNFKQPYNHLHAVFLTTLFSWAFLIQAILFLAIMLFAFAYPTPPESMLKPLCVATLLMVIWIGLTLPVIQRDVFNLYSLFFASLVIFNGGRIILEVFNFNEKGMLLPGFAGETWTRTVILVLASLSSFHFGGMITRFRRPVYQPFMNSHLKNAYHVGITITLISAVPYLIVTFRQLLVVMREGYIGLYGQEHLTGMEAGLTRTLSNLSTFILPGLLLLFAGSKNDFRRSRTIFIIIIIYSLLQLFMGRRSWGSMSLISAVWLWHVLIRPLALKKVLVGGMVLLLFVFPTLKTFRASTGSDRTSLEYFINSYISIDNPSLEIISEMGWSMNTVAYVLEIVPSAMPFQLGASYAYATTSLIPNFFWRVHPALERGALARWLTNMENPTEGGAGLGFSCIAEAYVNFGWMGAPLTMLFVGYLMARLCQWGNEGTPAAKAVVAISICYLLFWARGDVTVFIRPLFYGALVPYLAILYLQRREQHVRNDFRI